MQQLQQRSSPISASKQKLQRAKIDSSGARIFGLKNEDGQYNCYMNVVVQVLWHLDSVRKALIDFSKVELNHLKDFREYKFLQELQALFRQLQEDQSTDSFSINCMRRELFKLFYEEQLFEVNQKGDSSEALLCLLRIIHLAYVDPNQRRVCKSFDDELDLQCISSCIIHQNFCIRSQEHLNCKCGNKKAFDKYNNNFVQVINMFEYLEKINQNPYDQMKIQDLIKIENINYNCDKKTCVFKESTYFQTIEAPYPKTLVLNFNWQADEAKSVDLLQVFLTLDDRVKLNHLYKIPSNDLSIDQKAYSLKAFTCFLGAHYLVFIRQQIENTKISSGSWKLFNDLLIKDFDEWYDVINFCLESKCIPTLIIYEQQGYMMNTPGYDDLIIKRSQIEELQFKAMDQDSCLAGMMDDSQFIKEQEEMFLNLEKNNSSDENQIVIKKEESSGSIPDFNEMQQNYNSYIETQSQVQGTVIQKLDQLKKKYSKYDVFIHECHKCRHLMMIHQSKCINCQEPNLYLDTSIEILKADESKINEKLLTLSQTIQGKICDLQSLNSIKTDDDLATTVSKDSRNITSQLTAQNEQFSQKVQEIVKQEPEEQKQIQKQFVTKWICPRCRNKYLLEQKCKLCRISLQDLPDDQDLDKILVEEEVVPDDDQQNQQINNVEIKVDIREAQNKAQIQNENSLLQKVNQPRGDDKLRESINESKQDGKIVVKINNPQVFFNLLINLDKC
ncbi:ubiquitin carboxyl-terminal hydrolase-related protein [Stylonychia lemnae]|uniref:Ubiquitin carboxyl-terminal hydrolase-related protein n=1 Tax=Stylonychia lemnae TaxID=5949 RepID=A0A077ZX51_STYLE|nr:ubiquitin carboxyl-terminal hydrolase-related protein [Stylonychia lemnae]|eukprot:CDW73817.1 ubiquitin carboxyl-terminal hydrolase-related protein [Stylonychia lemnae]